MIEISDHFNNRKLLRYTLPSIMMLIVTSLYWVVDGYFVSNYAGKTAFAAENFIMPIIMILGCVGFMFGTGGGALISKTMGEQKPERANEIFSMVVAASAICGIFFTAAGLLLVRPIATMMGAEGEMLKGCVLYGRIVLLGLPFYIIQFEFQCLFPTAGKHKLGLYITILSGVVNAVLDAILVGIMGKGLAGAAEATVIGQIVGSVIPLVYFMRENSSYLRLVKFRFDFRALGRVCTNGVSELMSEISFSIVSVIFNIQLMKYIGENGVAAYGILMYVGYIFVAVFIGYSVGVAPSVGYNYGAQNHSELQNLLKRSFVIIGAFAVILFAAGELMAVPWTMLFAGYDPELSKLTVHAFRIFACTYLLSGFAIFGSSFFTALNDGLTSAAISFLRALVFECIAVIVLPLIIGAEGIWLSMIVAEVMAVITMLSFLIAKRKKYNYF